ncbi:MAG: protein translocase subunit SecDF [Porphyromonas sp.]|nr:protein translocase subunit SecDF [Porphyromonas sp.]
MQNKGLVKIVALLMVVLSAWYLSFSFVSSRYTSAAKEYAQGDPMKEIRYLDSLSNKTVWFGYTLKEVRAQEIGLGLDLKGGMNVVLELNQADVLRSLSGNSQDPNFLKAIEEANKKKTQSQKDFVTLFIEEFHKADPGARLAAIFSTLELKDRISTTASDSDVEKVLRSEVNEAIDSSFKVLRNRIDRFGVVAPNIQRLENNSRILIELPGIKEPERVRKLLQGAANLEFWETADMSEVFRPLLNANDALATLNRRSSLQETEIAVAEETPAAEEETPSVETEKAVAEADSTDLSQQVQAQAGTEPEVSSEEQKRDNPLLSILSLNASVNGEAAPGAIVGYAQAADMAVIDSLLSIPEVKAQLPRNIYLKWSAKPYSEEGKVYALYALKSSKRDGSAALSGEVVTEARAEVNNHVGRSDVGVSMHMNNEGAKQWARITRDNVGKQVAIVLDGLVYSAPVVNGEIPNGVSSITGNFSMDEANDLANTLKSGKMAASVDIVQEDIIGPSLGKEAIKAGVISFIIALVILMLYMCLVYGLLPGMVVNLALVLNFFFTLGILASLHAVLTLAGIAGLVLTLAMAVDANVLIFERIKEELAAGKNMQRAIKDGYGNAFSAIIDSNVTTIITGIILFMFGTGPIRGFATTLVVGLICSFITAVFITRLIFESMAKKGKMDKITFTTGISKNFLKNPAVNFLGKKKISFSAFGALLAIGIVALFTVKLNAGIDFTGGRNYIVKFDQNVSTVEVASMLSDELEGNVRVINIGTPDQVRISTNYRITDTDPNTDEDVEKLVFEGVKSLLPAGTSFDTFVDKYVQSSQKVGATMADDIQRDALIAVTISLIFMALYILIRFRDIAFSVGAFVSVTLNTFSIIALYAILWKIMPFSMEVDTTFIAALLAIIGYSINDTVVVFDRIREVSGIYPNKNKKDVFNNALNSTLARTINTSLTTLITIIVIFILGGPTIRSFTFAMILGVVIGTISTLFVASPIAYMIASRKEKNREEK